MNSTDAKIALITGATSGIGEACATRLATHGYDLILTARRQERLQQLAQQLAQTHGVRTLPLAFDVSRFDQVQEHLQGLAPEWQAVDVLLNNAGLALGRQPLPAGEVSDWDQMIDTNLKGLLYVTKLIAPGMVSRRRGHIVNVSSIAGKQISVNAALYTATKHAVDVLSQSLRIELLPHNIRVTNIAPGLVDTNFYAVLYGGDQQKAADFQQGLRPLAAADVAEVIYFALSRPAHVTLDDIVVMPTAQASTRDFFRQPA